MADHRAPVAGFINYPRPIPVQDYAFGPSGPRPFLDTKKPYPSGPGIPALRGQFLRIASAVVSHVPFVARSLFQFTGFAKQSTIPGLILVSPRYDPTVVPLHSIESEDVDDDDDDGKVDDLKGDNAVMTDTRAGTVFYSIKDFGRAYKNREFTPSDVADVLLSIITTPGHPLHQVFAHVRPDLVRKAAAESTTRWQRGQPLSDLDGVPFSVKDSFDVTGYPRTCGTVLDFPALDKPVNEKETSWCVAKLVERGAIVIGIATMHEMAVDGTNCNPHQGTPPNPYAPGLIFAGGSSGGSAASVGSGLVPFSIGTDGAGSVRCPAGFCGVYGLKPSHNRISGRPSMSEANLSGVIGPLAATLEDVAHVYAVMSEWDRDAGVAEFPISIPRSLDFAPHFYSRRSRPAKYVLGIYNPWFESADEPVRTACRLAIGRLVETGQFETVDIQLPFIDIAHKSHMATISNEMINTFKLAEHQYRSVTPSTSSIRNGLLPISFRSLCSSTRITFTVCSQCPAFEWMNAQRVRNMMMQHIAALFRSHVNDGETASKLIIVTPTSGALGWPMRPTDVVAGLSNVDMTLKVFRFAWLANSTGLPSISAPVGYAPVDAVKGVRATTAIGVENVAPIGIMGTAEWGNEHATLEFGNAVREVMKQEARPRPKLWVDVFDLARKWARTRIESAGVSASADPTGDQVD